MIGYDPDYDYLLDPQQASAVGFCQNCGREIYTVGKDFCDDCEED